MKTDIYTKIVLTVIAICLTIIVLDNIVGIKTIIPQIAEEKREIQLIRLSGSLDLGGNLDVTVENAYSSQPFQIRIID